MLFHHCDCPCLLSVYPLVIVMECDYCECFSSVSSEAGRGLSGQPFATIFTSGMLRALRWSSSFHSCIVFFKAASWALAHRKKLHWHVSKGLGSKSVVKSGKESSSIVSLTLSPDEMQKKTVFKLLKAKRKLWRVLALLTICTKRGTLKWPLNVIQKHRARIWLIATGIGNSYSRAYSKSSEKISGLVMERTYSPCSLVIIISISLAGRMFRKLLHLSPKLLPWMIPSRGDQFVTPFSKTSKAAG